MKDLFKLDLRSLATLRIGCALLVIIDLIRRLPDLRLLYSDLGLYPRLQYFADYRFPGLWSLHAAVGSPSAEGVLFALTFGAALCLLLGYRTLISGLVTWALVASMQTRNEMLNNGGDEYLRLLLFWGLFLPWGRRFALDAWRESTGTTETEVRSPGTIALLAQVMIIYWFTSHLKSGPEWRVDFSAIFYALSYQQYATRFGHWLLQFPDMLRAMTHGVIWVEDYALYFLLLPPRFYRVRLATVGALIALHIGIGLTMNLTLFPPICCVALLAFLPSEVWSWLGVPATAGATAPAPSPSRLRQWRELAAATIVGLLLPLTLAWNLAGMPGHQFALPESVRWVGVALRLDQAWGMFAPGPPRDDGWFVVRGERIDGKHVNVLSGEQRDPGFTRPDLPAETFRTGHWRTFLNHLRHNREKSQFVALGAGYCRLWNQAPASYGETLRSFDVYYVERTLRDDGRPSAELPSLLWHQACFPQAPVAKVQTHLGSAKL